MLRKDKIAIQKIVSEMNVGMKLLGETSLDDFLENEMLKRALGMTVINIGELTKVISDELRDRHKDFPWRAVAGMRDITAHRYQTLRMEDVYTTVRDEYSILKSQLEQILINENENTRIFKDKNL